MMCLILDTNKYSDFLDLGNKDMEPVRDWIENKNGRIAYAQTEEMERELSRHRGMRRQIKKYDSLGKLKLERKDKVNEFKDSLGNLKSNDAHIIALAQAAEVKLLVSDDQKLGEDFQRKIPKGKIYKRKRHAHLLNEAACP